MKIPAEVKNIIEELKKRGFEAYVVGGCVRDLLLGKEPKDWDVTTSAKPEEIQKIFSSFAEATEDRPATFYENRFGTVGVKIPSRPPLQKGEEAKVVEVTTFRAEAKYTDKRHPDEIRFVESLDEDLARRDFTINALALRLGSGQALKIGKQTPPPPPLTKGGMKGGLKIIDLFGGQEDLKNKIIRAVGNPDERFSEDALRMLRAVRFAVELDFIIEPETFKAIQKNSGWLEAIAKERIRDEFIKIIMSKKPHEGVELLRGAELLKYIIPELEKGVGITQNRHHIYTVYEHGILSLKFAAQKNYDLVVRLAALLHDIAKPEVKEGEGPEATFYNHDYVGAKWAVRILDRLRFPREIVERVANLIKNHMFVYDVGAVTEAGIRRLLRRVGPENMNGLIALRVADRLGSGVPKAQPYRLRHFQYMVEKVQHDPLSVKMLKINGNEIMELLGIEPGPIIGAILDVLLAEVIEEPKRNTKEYLSKRTKELSKMDLPKLREMAKEKIEEKKEEEDQIIKQRYWVK